MVPGKIVGHGAKELLTKVIKGKGEKARLTAENTLKNYDLF